MRSPLCHRYCVWWGSFPVRGAKVTVLTTRPYVGSSCVASMTAMKSGPGKAFLILLSPPPSVPGRFLTSLTSVSAMFSSPAQTSSHFFGVALSERARSLDTRWFCTQYCLPSDAVFASVIVWTSA